MNLSRKGTLALALTATAASFWLHLYASRGGSAQMQADALPDLYIEQPQWDLFDEQGRPVRQLRAERLEQWAGEPHARLIQPRLNIRDHHQRHWELRAGRGRMSADGQPLSLEQQVVLEPGGDARDGTTVSTERLKIAGNGALVETDAPVVLQSGNWHFSAGGLRADLGQQRVELLNRVRGTHE